MIQSKSGTLLVIAATVVTAVLILTTSRDAISPSKTKEIVEVSDVQKETVVSVETQEKEAVAVDVEKEIETKVEESVSTNEEKNTLITQTEPVEIKAPEGPYNKAEDGSATNEETSEQSDDSEMVVTESQQLDDQAIKVESINVVATSTQHDLLNHLIQPIWMDQKLGDFKSVEKGEVVFKMMPTTPEGLQGEDPKNVVTNDSDKFAPTTVSADYNYQQMPMYNGGYYIAPMPPYLMESMLPVTNQNIDK